MGGTRPGSGSVDPEHDLPVHLPAAQPVDGRAQLAPAHLQSDLRPQPASSDEAHEQPEVPPERLDAAFVDEEALDAAEGPASQVTQADASGLGTHRPVERDHAVSRQGMSRSLQGGAADAFHNEVELAVQRVALEDHRYGAQLPEPRTSSGAAHGGGHLGAGD